MTKQISYVIIILLAVSDIYGQFLWQTKLPDSGNGYVYNYYSVDCTEGRNITVLGTTYDNGFTYKQMLLRSEDGGNSWKEFPTPIPPFYSIDGLQLDVISCLDSSHIYAVGDTGIFTYSIDACRSWFPVARLSDVKLNDVSFVDSLHGIIIGDRGFIFVTMDGCSTWDTIQTSNKRSLVKVETFAGGKYIVFELSYGRMFRSYDYGRSWDTMTVYDSKTRYQTKDVAFTDSLTGFLVGLEFTSQGAIYNSLLMSTVNGGNTWEIVFDTSDHTKIQDLFSITFLSDKVGIAVGRGLFSYVTFDGGKTWDYSANGVGQQGDRQEMISRLTNNSALCVSGSVKGFTGYVYSVSYTANSAISKNTNKSEDLIVTSTISTGRVRISVPLIKDGIVSIINSLGIVVFAQSLPPSGVIDIDLSAMPNGMYWVRLTKNGYSSSFERFFLSQ